MSTTTTEWQAPAVPEEAQPEKGLDFLNAILSRKFLVVTCVIIGLVVGHLHFTRQPPVFASFAKVMVIRPPQVFESEDRSTSRNGKSMNAVDMLENHIYLLTQPKILDGAINPVVDAAEVDSTATSTDAGSVAVAKKSAKNKKDSIATLATLAASSNPTATIASGLRVLRSEVSEDVIEISFIGPNQGDCGRILEAVLGLISGGCSGPRSTARGRCESFWNRDVGISRPKLHPIGRTMTISGREQRFCFAKTRV